MCADAVLPAPGVDGLLADPEVARDVGDGASAGDQVQHSAPELRRIATTSHEALLQGSSGTRVQGSGSTERGTHQPPPTSTTGGSTCGTITSAGAGWSSCRPSRGPAPAGTGRRSRSPPSSSRPTASPLSSCPASTRTTAPCSTSTRRSTRGTPTSGRAPGQPPHDHRHAPVASPPPAGAVAALRLGWWTASDAPFSPATRDSPGTRSGARRRRGRRRTPVPSPVGARSTGTDAEIRSTGRNDARPFEQDGRRCVHRRAAPALLTSTTPATTARAARAQPM